MNSDQNTKAKPKTKFTLFRILTGLIVIVLMALAGFRGQQVIHLSAENDLLKSKIVSVEQEIADLKKTADFHFQEAVNMINAEQYARAKVEFETVIQKYPTSQLISSANKELRKVERILINIEAEKIAEEERRRETEKYKPRDPEEAIAEWNLFRKNEEKYKGTITTWRFRVSIVQSRNIVGYLDRVLRKFGSKNPVAVKDYQMIAMFEKFPVVKEGDWILVTGMFEYVSTDNVIVLKPLRVVNEGYK